MNPGDDRFEELYERYRRSTINFLLRLGFPREEAVDLAQETFTRVYKNMGRYRGEAEWSYIEKVARSVAYNVLRARGTHKRKGDEVPIEEQTDVAAPEAAPEEVLDQRALIARLRGVIETLPPSLKAPLLLQLEGFTYAEVAKILKITVDAVKSRLRDARIQIRERLGIDVESPEDDK